MENTVKLLLPYNSPEEFEKRLKENIKETIQEIISASVDSKTIDEYLTRKQVAELLHISLVTLHQLTIEGKLPGYRLKGRVLYKCAEIDKALVKIAAIKYSRTR